MKKNPPQSRLERFLADRPQLPYVVPFVLFLGFIALEGYWEQGYPVIYAVKTVVIGWLLWELIRQGYFPELRTRNRADGKTLEKAGHWVLAILVGVIVFIGWVGIEKLSNAYFPYPKAVDLHPYDVFDHLGTGAGAWMFIAFRLIGAAVVVPVMEELFWRSFLLRFCMHPDFEKVEIGAFAWPAFFITVGLFGLEHYEWLVGLLCGIVFNLLIYYTKRIWPCIIAHAITNLALGIYVLITRDWAFW